MDITGRSPDSAGIVTFIGQYRIIWKRGELYIYNLSITVGNSDSKDSISVITGGSVFNIVCTGFDHAVIVTNIAIGKYLGITCDEIATFQITVTTKKITR